MQRIIAIETFDLFIQRITKDLSGIERVNYLYSAIQRMTSQQAQHWMSPESKTEIQRNISVLQRHLDTALSILWEEFDIPIDEDECLEENFYFFDAGTHRETVWHWFDERHSKGVAEGLMYAEFDSN